METEVDKDDDGDDDASSGSSTASTITYPIVRRVHRNDPKDHQLMMISNWFVPEMYSLYDRDGVFYFTERTYKLSYWQRFFVTFEVPTACVMSKVVNFIIMTATLLSCTVYILNTVPSMKQHVEKCIMPVCNDDPILCPGRMICEPIPMPFLGNIETTALAIFIVDYVIRISLVACVPARIAGIVDEGPIIDKVENTGINDADPVFSPLCQLYLYTFQYMNLIDFIAIFPFFLQLSGTSGSSATIVRVLRLARILRSIKLGKNSQGMTLIVNTLIASLPAMTMLAFFLTIGVILSASIEFYFESGVFTVDENFPLGAYVTKDDVGSSIESAFTSIPIAIYWAIVTSCTVGYGDVVAHTAGGRFIAVLCMYFGIIVLAFPISVIGNKFDKFYDASQGSISEVVRESMLVLMKPWNCNKKSQNRQIAEEAARKLCSILILGHILLDKKDIQKLHQLLDNMGLQNALDSLVEVEEDLPHERYDSMSSKDIIARYGEFVKDGSSRFAANSNASKQIALELEQKRKKYDEINEIASSLIELARLARKKNELELKNESNSVDLRDFFDFKRNLFDKSSSSSSRRK